MAQAEKVRDRIQALDERLARLRNEKNRLVARASHTERTPRHEAQNSHRRRRARGHRPRRRSAAAFTGEISISGATASSYTHTIERYSSSRRKRGSAEKAGRRSTPARPKRSGRQGCRPKGGTARRRAASLTAARPKGIVPGSNETVTGVDLEMGSFLTSVRVTTQRVIPDPLERSKKTMSASL